MEPRVSRAQQPGAAVESAQHTELGRKTVGTPLAFSPASQAGSAGGMYRARPPGSLGMLRNSLRPEQVFIPRCLGASTIILHDSLKAPCGMPATWDAGPQGHGPAAAAAEVPRDQQDHAGGSRERQAGSRSCQRSVWCKAVTWPP